MASDPNSQGARLDAISTRWSLVRQAHDAGQHSTAAQARNLLVLRYARAIRKYLGGILKNSEDADELAQEVMVRLLQGDFAGADPNRGRFRDLLKTVVRNMVRNFWAREERRRPAEVDPNLLAGADDALDQAWLAAWQNNVLEHAWAALHDVEKQNPANPAHTLLKLRADFPDDSSEQLAARLSAKIGTTFRADHTRQLLHRARARFSELLIAEVEAGLADPTSERVNEELADLGLLTYVKAEPGA